MNLFLVFRRFEITFWAILIPLMRRKRLVYLCALLIFFNLSLLLGYLMVPIFEPNQRAFGGLLQTTLPTLPGRQSATTGASGQDNLLLILVDCLGDRSPHLEGIWLVVYSGNSPAVTLLPVFPASLPDHQNVDSRLERSFGLDDRRRPTATFLAELERLDLLWHHYVILDDAGLTRMEGLSTAQDIVDNERCAPTASKAARVSLPSSSYGQAVRLAQVCQQSAQTRPEPTLFFELLLVHLSTDLTPEAAIAYWPSPAKSGGKHPCEFPTLEYNPLTAGAALPGVSQGGQWPDNRP